MTPLVILGCGYVGTRIARAALAAQRPVRVCARSTSRLVLLGEAGAEVKYLDAAMPKQLPAVLSGSAGGTVVYSIPPVTQLPPGQAVRAALQAAYGAGAGCFVYFSSSGLYGDQPDDEIVIDEDTPIVTNDPPMKNVHADEEEIVRSQFARLRTVILRLAPVYGPGRGVRERMRKQQYRILENGQHTISRIFVEDVARVVFAAEEHAPAKSLYLVADDEPTTQGEYAQWLSDRMKLPLPPSREMVEPGGTRAAHRNRRISNARMKRELHLELRYPTFREGEAAIEAAENAVGQ